MKKNLLFFTLVIASSALIAGDFSNNDDAIDSFYNTTEAGIAAYLAMMRGQSPTPAQAEKIEKQKQRIQKTNSSKGTTGS